MNLEVNKIYNEDCLTGLKKLPDNSVDMCCTSPPYFNLRDYGITGQIGLEETPELFVESLVAVFNEVKRVLKKEGTLWLNLGDSYNGSGKGEGGGGIGEFSKIQVGNVGSTSVKSTRLKGLKPKDLIGVPWMVAFALRSDGWYLRQDIIWSKRNCMPESMTDRCTKSHEYIFLLAKNQKYYFNNEAIKTKMECSEHDARTRQSRKRFPTEKINGIRGNNAEIRGYANKRSVWETTVIPFKESHFATFPEKLIIDCIKAGCPEKIFTCDCCGNDLYLQSKTNGYDTENKKMSSMQDGISGNGQKEQGANILFKEVQSDMDCSTSKINEGMDDRKQGLQNDCNTDTSDGFAMRLCNGASVGDGKTHGKVSNEKRNSTSSEQYKDGQPNRKSAIIDEILSRQTTQTTQETDLLSSLWEENNSIGACPKCGKGLMIARRGVVLDCFMGAGTTGLVAKKLNRNFIGYELNPEYIKIAEKRIFNEIGLFN